MQKIVLAGVAALVLAGSTAVYAQHRPWFEHHMRMSQEDRAAFADARIAAVHAGLKLSPDQEKLWPPVEQAVRDFAKLRLDRANARMDMRRDRNRDDQRDNQNDMPRDPITRLRDRAIAMGQTADAMKKIADSADPLYKTLDDGQKRRLAFLTHMRGGEGRFGGGEDWRRRGPGPGDDRDLGRDDRGPRPHDRDRGNDHGPDGGPEHL